MQIRIRKEKRYFETDNYHSCLPAQMTLVHDYAGMMSYPQKRDEDHVGGSVTLENAYRRAYDLT